LEKEQDFFAPFPALGDWQKKKTLKILASFLQYPLSPDSPDT
jgi:hypothetical protein